jgi:phage tail sheath gpL-like
MVSTAVDPNAVARVVGVETNFENLVGGARFLPMRVALIGQGSTSVTYSLTKRIVLSAVEVGQTYGFGCPLHLSALELLPENGDGLGRIPLTIYPLDDNVAGVAAAGDLTPLGVQTKSASYRIVINEIKGAFFVISKDEIVDSALFDKIADSVNANVAMPMIASNGGTEVDFVAKWEGVSGNDLEVSIEGEVAGITFAFTQPSGGLVNPSIQPALDQFSTVWESLVLNCLNISDSDALDALESFGEGRWGPLVKTPFMSFTGTSEPDVTTAIVIPEGRKQTDRINGQLVAPGSTNLPFVIAARQLARMAVQANINPPVDYAGKKLTGIIPGPDAEQWKTTERDVAVKGGSSTIEIVGNVGEMSDTVIFYHPEGVANPAYRYVVNNIKVMNLIFRIRGIFEADDWKGKVLINDGDPTDNADARSPSMAKAEMAVMYEDLLKAAIIVDLPYALANLQAAIDGSNPNRMNISSTVKISGIGIIYSITNNFGFNVGG